MSQQCVQAVTGSGIPCSAVVQYPWNVNFIWCISAQHSCLLQDASIQQLYIVNPLWKTEGNLVSEFGIGPWRKANEEFVATFEPSYQLFEQRIGAPSSINMANNSRYASGGVVRVLRAYPGQYEVHVMASNGASQVRVG